MKASRIRLGVLVTAIATIGASPAADAEYLVPPSNSAATQYTESIPTAGGRRDAERGNSLGGGSPREVLGSRNAQRLEAAGPAGRAAAELAAATAPQPAASGDAPATDGPGASGKPSRAGGGGEAPGSGAKGAAASDEPSGSSGFSETVSQALGSPSSGELGLLLPLLIVGALCWSLWYALRQRRRPTT
jgi:hypothetical protein